MTLIPISGLPAIVVARHLTLYARDLYELNGDPGPHQITGERTLVEWDPEGDGHAVFTLDGVVLRVPSAALDDVGLEPANAHFRTTEAPPAPTTHNPGGVA